MRIVKTGTAGTLESSDIMITVRSNGTDGVQIALQSIVEKQFGKQIRATIEDTLKSMSIDHAYIDVKDQGALDCAITSRLVTALYRAAGIEKIDWEAL
jgi:citrate lyase subunit gamma (acyl carrier protein)